MILTRLKQILNRVLLNTDAEFNVISQCFTVKKDMTKINTELSHFILLNKQPKYCYNAYLVIYCLKDNWRQECICKHIFYVLKKNESELILDLLALQKEWVHIDCVLQIWHFDIKSQSISLKKSEEFKHNIQDSVICDLIWTKSDVIMMCLQDINIISALSKIYNDYVDVFSELKTECLLTHEKHDHVIEINDENSLHNSLYNLSKTELQFLWMYLNDVLMKNWIQHFINFAETSILFVLKKNEDLWLCVDYRDLNKITIKNHHFLSFISEILNHLNDTKIFIKLNLKNVYHQIRIHQDNK